MYSASTLHHVPLNTSIIYLSTVYCVLHRRKTFVHEAQHLRLSADTVNVTAVSVQSGERIVHTVFVRTEEGQTFSHGTVSALIHGLLGPRLGGLDARSHPSSTALEKVSRVMTAKRSLNMVILLLMLLADGNV